TETPSPTPIPTWTLVPATPTQTPLPTATPLPELSTGQAIIVGGDVRTRAEPSTQAEVVRELEDLSVITVVDRVQGEDWLKGQQDWFAGTPPWSKEWFQLDDGSYVYGPFVFILGEGERSPLAPVPGGVEKWIDVSISQQTARAMV